MRAQPSKVLIVVTSHGNLGSTGRETGYYLPEVAHPYQELARAGFEVDIASPAGGKAPVDPASLQMDDVDVKEFWETPVSRAKVDSSATLRSVNPADYRAVVFAGGHGTMWDFPENPEVERISRGIWKAGGVVAAICHGPAALVGIRLSDGKRLIEGRNVAAFSNAEEEAVSLTEVMPFLLESALRDGGATYTSAEPWQAHVVTDGHLVTGQNPASARGVAQEVIRILRKP